MQQYPESILEKYNKVSVMGTRGTGGERSNALRIKAKMESQYPGIVYQAGKKMKEDTNPPLGPYDAANGAFGGEDPWKKWAKFAGEAFSWASSVASEVSQLEYAREFAAKAVEVKAKNLQSNKRQISASIPLKELYNVAKSMTPAQKEAFVQSVGAMVAMRLYQDLVD